MATAVGILNEGVVTANTTIFDPGVITVDQKYLENDPNPQPRKYVCWTYKNTGAGHGEVSYLKGIAQSCDVYFYMVGGGYKDEIPEGLGIWRIGEYARALGYGMVSGIELPGEAKGLIPDPNWKRTTVGENWSTGRYVYFHDWPGLRAGYPPASAQRHFHHCQWGKIDASYPGA